MPIAGQGMVPSGASFNELSAVTLRSFIPKLVVQLYRSTPILSLLLRNAQRAGGGLSQITVPVQGSSLVNFSYTDYVGTFAQPSVLNAVQNAEFNLSLGVVPVPLVGPELLVQDDNAVVSLLEARMADVKNVMLTRITTDLFSNNSVNPLAPFGLQQIYNTGTNYPVYGNINRTTSGNSFWNGQLVTSAGAILTRAALTARIVQVTTNAGGESPDMIILSPNDWATLQQDFVGVERLVQDPSGRYNKMEHQNAGFPTLSLMNIPVFFDPACPVGSAYFINSKYLAMYVHRNADFAFTGFQNTVPNLQFGYLGLVILAFQLVCTKPVSGAQYTGITGAAF